MSLEDKIMDVFGLIQGLDTYGAEIDYDEGVSQIKQAFADEQYAKITKDTYRDQENKKYTQYVIRYVDGSGEMVRIPQFYVMSGDAWYDRFSRELCPPSTDGSTKNVHATYTISEIKEAAKRASGVTND